MPHGTTLPVNILALTGISQANLVSGTTNYYFENTPPARTWIEVYNPTGGSLNVTVVSSYTTQGLNLDDDVVAIPAGGTKLIGPFTTSIFNQLADDPYVYVDTTSTSIGFRCYRLP